MKLGGTLKMLREERNISQETLAKYLGISRSTLSMYEQSKRHIDDDVKIQICELFGIDMNYLYGLNRKNIKKDLFTPRELEMIMKYREFPHSVQEVVNDLFNEFYKIKKESQLSDSQIKEI